MRNLVHYSHREGVIDDANQDQVVNVQHIALDSDNGYVYVATQSLLITCLEPSSFSSRRRWTADLRHLVPDLLPDATIVDFKFLDSSESLCIAVSSGQILLLCNELECEEVGAVEGGLAAAAWSPDGEILAALSTLGRLLFIRNSDVHDVASLSLECDVPVRNEDPEYPQPTAPSFGELTYNEAPPLTPNSAGLTWRGDGRYLATCTVDNPDLPARIRVWDRTGARLHALGELVSNIVPRSITWQPNGRHIYVARTVLMDPKGGEQVQLTKSSERPGAQGQAPEVRHVGAWKRELKRREERDSSPEQYDVLIFERNGLQHGGFMRGFNALKTEQVEQMSWSPDSRVLAIVTESSSHKSLQLWHRSNWHWYLKHERRFAASSAKLSLCWELTLIGNDSSGPGLFALWVSSGCKNFEHSGAKVERMEFLWDAVVAPHSGTVAVIDGPQLLITPLSKGLVPPPTAAVTYELPAPVMCVHMVEGDDVDGATIAAVTSDGRLSILTCQYHEEDENENEYSITLTRTIELSGVLNHGLVRRVVWVGSDLVLLVVRTLTTEQVYGDCLVCFRVADDDAFQTKINLPDGQECLYCTEILDHRGIKALGCFFQTSNGHVWRFEPGNALHLVGPLPQQVAAQRPSDNDDVRYVKLIAMEETAARASLLIIALSSSSQLVVWRGMEAVHAAGAVTSVALRPGGPGGGHVLYTTKSHALWCYDVSFTASISSRRVEEDALLLAAPSTGVRVICQAPRGNLETVCPRPLVLAAVKQALKSGGDGDGDYEEAWSLASANRIDPSIIVQYDWPVGLQKQRVQRLLEAIGSDMEAAEFIGSLKEGMEREGLECFCIAVRDVMLESVEHGDACDGDNGGQSSWFRTELATYAACDDLPMALKRIKCVKEDEREGGLAEKGLRYLLTHQPEEVVYRAALGAYELELAYMVVTHSTKDPGEALMELQRFAAIENELVRMAEIDKHLGRYEGAVRHLVAAGSAHLEAAIELAKAHGLFAQLSDACGVLNQNGDQMKLAVSTLEQSQHSSKVLAAWAEELGGKRGKHEDAALALVAAKDLDRGLREYKLGGRWRSALALAESISQEMVVSMARRFAVDLEEGHRHAEAATVCLEYLHDVDEGVRLLTEAGEWNEAVRVASRGGEEQVRVRANLVSAAITVAATRIESLLEDIEKIGEYCNRLREIRSKRAAMKVVVEGDRGQEEFYAQGGYDGDGKSDVTGTTIFAPSQTYTGTGTGSVTTVGGKKGKGGKKGSRKASKSGKIRRGSPQEESAIARLLLAIHPPSAVFRETGELTEVLVMFGRLADAARLQGALKTLVDVHLQAREDLLRSPPPGLGLDGSMSPEAIKTARERGGEAAVEALMIAAAAIPGEDLSRRAAECAAAAKSVSWKWEILRNMKAH
jgi:hypothetical protein